MFGSTVMVFVCVIDVQNENSWIYGCQAASCFPQEYEREKHAHSVLQFQFNEMKETLKQSEELLNVSIWLPVWICDSECEAGCRNGAFPGLNRQTFTFLLSFRKAARWGAFHNFLSFSPTINTCSLSLSSSQTFFCCLGDPPAAYETRWFC